MSTDKKGLAAMSVEQRTAVIQKAQETRRQNAENRRLMTEQGVKFKTPIKAIREKCLDCCGNQYSEVELCTVPTCPLFPFRMGKRPRDFEDLQVRTKETSSSEEEIELEDIDIEEDSDEGTDSETQEEN